MDEQITHKSRVTKSSKYYMDVIIPPECMDEDGAPCPHSKEEVKRDQNPV